MTVIVISGPPGAGSSTVARGVAEELGIEYFSPGKHFKEKIDGNETESANLGWKDDELSSKSTHQSIDDLQKKVARQNDVVIDGKLSIHMVGDIADLNVWLTAPLSVRAQRSAERDDMDVERAKEMMQERQRDEIEQWREMYGLNYMEQRKSADLVIETEDRSPEDIIETVISKVS
ncbi:MAG: cytidylate kinase family protein [Candidatus Nanohaloarchaeota archaeon QJJ-5]|nr:cytidylate kinase family protein [Candidatus Nanohaloarchaeota archaeon QJJ-5]